MKLIITDTGDRSVGIEPIEWEVEVPFDKDLFDGEELKENLEFFRNKMIEVYQCYCQCECGAAYDFELEDEARYEDEMP